MSSDPDERSIARLLDNPAVWAEVTPGLKERVLAEALGGAPEAEAETAETAGAGAADDEAGDIRAPADLRSRILAEASGETGAAGRGPGGEVAPLERPPRHAAPRSRRSRAARPPLWQRPALLAAAAAALVGLTVGGTLLATRDATPSAGAEVALAGTENLPDASATVELRSEASGVSVTLNVSGLPPAPERTFYEAWLVSEDRGKVSAGTFHVREPQDDITLWLGVDPANYDAITVTRQPIQGGTLADGVVLLRGDLP